MPRKQQITQKIKIDELTTGLNKCQLSEESSHDPTTGNIILADDINPELLDKWPKIKHKVPPVFLHKPVDFEQHVKKLLNMGIKFYQPQLGKNFTKITCETNNDHRHLVLYLEKKQLPFHTFGHPSKRKMKVVIRGLPIDVNLNKVKEALKSASIPIIRVHKMHTKQERKDDKMLVLAVVPYDDDGQTILKLKQLLGHDIKLEPPVTKPKQCYRCQKWGHSQRFCHGPLKCVKCAGDHLSKKCEKNPEDPPKCANCSADHTANCKDCTFAPDSVHYIMMQLLSLRKRHKPRQIVTLENYQTLYKNVDYDKVASNSI